jgi:hypothetical protein
MSNSSKKRRSTWKNTRNTNTRKSRSTRLRRRNIQKRIGGVGRLKLNDELQQIVGGVECVQKDKLTPDNLLEYAQKDAVTVVDMLSVTVETIDGKHLVVHLEGQNGKTTALNLKRAIQEKRGISTISQKLFPISAGATSEPMTDDAFVYNFATVCLIIEVELNEFWDTSSPLITNKIFEISGEGSSIATKIDQDNLNNCLWANRVMESGKHQMSLKLIKGEGDDLFHLLGLVRDGAAVRGQRRP